MNKIASFTLQKGKTMGLHLYMGAMEGYTCRPMGKTNFMTKKFSAAEKKNRNTIT